MKKIIAIMLVAIMSLSVFAVGTLADGAADSVNPANINGEAYSATPFITFDDDTQISFAPNTEGNKMTMDVVAEGGVKGKALKTAAINNSWAQGTIHFTETDFSEYDGMLFWVDLSALKMDPANEALGQPNGIALRFKSNYVGGSAWTRNDQAPIVEGHKIDVYYLDGSEWKLCVQDVMRGERFIRPAQFKGWVYVPFASYISTKGPDGIPVAGIYGDIGMGNMMILTGCYQKEDSVAMYFDEFQLVKLGTAAETQPAETQPAETQPAETQPAETQPAETQPAETQPAETTPVETAPAETTPTEDTAPVEEPAGGCGSAIGASVALVAVAVLGTATVSKKRR